jgi:hypothetical protein
MTVREMRGGLFSLASSVVIDHRWLPANPTAVIRQW